MRKESAQPKWLTRELAAPGPYLTLVLAQEELDKELKRLGIKERPSLLATPQANATAHYLLTPSGKLCCLVALGDTSARDPIEVAGLLVHEAVHVWQVYAEHIGETEPGKEQEAYAVQAISQALMAEYARRMVGGR